MRSIERCVEYVLTGRISIIFIILFGVFSNPFVHCVDGPPKHKWTPHELTHTTFPYLQSTDDIYLNPCKAKAFLNGDIALSDEDLSRFIDENEVNSVVFEQRNATASNLTRTPSRVTAQHRIEVRSESEMFANALSTQFYKLVSKMTERNLNNATGHLIRNRQRANKRQLWRKLKKDCKKNFADRKLKKLCKWRYRKLFRKFVRKNKRSKLLFLPAVPCQYQADLFFKGNMDLNLEVIERSNCCSYVGKRGEGPQAISIGKNCDKFGIVVHELGHVVGFWHEHTRPDRDGHVSIKYDNIQEGQNYNFKKLESGDVNSLGQPYDFASIMHYARDTFSKGQYYDTIVPKVNGAEVTENSPEIGQRIQLSPGDITQANLLYQCPRCGYTMMEPSGHFTVPVPNEVVQGRMTSLPGYSDQYLKSFSFSEGAEVIEKMNDHCQWRIIAAAGSIITLNISRLLLPIPPSASCENSPSYLDIRDGHYARSPLIKRLCRSFNESTAVMVSSQTNRLWIEYRNTDVHGTYRAPLHDNEEETGYGENSINYYNVRPMYQAPLVAGYKFNCGGSIRGDKGLIQSPNYPAKYLGDQDCTWFIEVPRGYQIALVFEFFSLENHVDCLYDYMEIYDSHRHLNSAGKTKLINKFCGYEAPENVKSSSNKMHIKFISDSSINQDGFSLRFMKEFNECSTGNHSCMHHCVNTLGSYQCECNIGFELAPDGRTCEETCGGFVTDETGTITSPNFPTVYPKSKRCVWEINTLNDHRITLNFTHFDIEGSKDNCDYDHIEVTSMDHGKIVESHGRFCGQHTELFILTSVSSQLRLEFVSDNSVQKSGFAAIYFTDLDECQTDNGGCEQHCRNTIGSYVCECGDGNILAPDGLHCKQGGCDHRITNYRGIIQSPNYPNEYPSDKECSWRIVTAPGHQLTLHFDKFEIEPHQDCMYDFLEVFDGGTSNHRKLLKGCGTDLPNDVMTTFNDVMVVFKSDGSVQRKGFQVSYFSECGGTLLANGQQNIIYSHPNFGGSRYPEKSHCLWYIFAKNDRSVSLRFISFDIENEKDCQYDYVAVYDGRDTSYPVINRFCGKDVPPRIVSSGSDVTIVFKSDDTIQAKGFIIEYQQTTSPPMGFYPLTTTTAHPLEPVINEQNSRYIPESNSRRGQNSHNHGNNQGDWQNQPTVETVTEQTSNAQWAPMD